MIRRIIISFAMVFTCLHIVADLGELLFPGNDFVYRDSKGGFYLVAAAIAIIITLLFTDKRKIQSKQV